MGKFRIGFIGAGNMAKKMANAIKKNSDIECYAVASQSRERMDAFITENKLKKCKRYDKYEDLVEDENIDMVYISTINVSHAKYAMMCIKNNKPVLVEKPFAISSEECLEILNEAKQRNVFVAEAMHIRYMDTIAYIKNTIQNGRIGEVEQLVVDLGFDMPDVERIVNDIQGGGALWDIGIYGIHLADIIFPDKPSEIVTRAFYNDKGLDIKGIVLLFYENAKEVSIRYDITRKNACRVIIYGTKGKIIMENGTKCEWVKVYNTRRIIGVKHARRSGYEQEILACKDVLQKADQIQVKDLTHSKILEMIKRVEEVKEIW